MLWRGGRICGTLLAQGLTINRTNTSVSRTLYPFQFRICSVLCYEKVCRIRCWYISVSEVKLRQYHFCWPLTVHHLTASVNLPEAESGGFWWLVTVVWPHSNALRGTYQWGLLPPFPTQLWLLMIHNGPKSVGRNSWFLPWRYENCKCQSVNICQRFPLSVISCRSPDSDSCTTHAAPQVPIIREGVFSNYSVQSWSHYL